MTSIVTFRPRVRGGVGSKGVPTLSFYEWTLEDLGPEGRGSLNSFGNLESRRTKGVNSLLYPLNYHWR